MNMFDLWYTIHDGGDGSCSTCFFHTEELANQDCTEGDDPEYRGRDLNRVRIAVVDGIPYIVEGDVLLPLSKS